MINPDPRRLSLAGLALAGALLAAGCGGAAGTADTATLAAPAGAMAMSQAALQVSAVGTAAGLAIAGRQAGDPELLVQAAEAMAAMPSREGDAPGEPDAEAPASLEPAVLLQEAEAMGPMSPELVERVAAVRAGLPAPAPGQPGAERGPQRYRASVAGRAHRRHELYFEGTAPAVIQVRGSGTSNLDVLLYDVNGELVASDAGPSDVATVHWYVPYTQTLTLVVRNRGPRANGYYVITN